MLFGPGPKQAAPFPRRPPHPGIKCFKCGGDHWARDCPQPSDGLAQPRFPPIERYCAKCCVEHFPKDCADKPGASTSLVPTTTGLNLIEVIPSPVGLEQEVENVSLWVVT